MFPTFRFSLAQIWHRRVAASSPLRNCGEVPARVLCWRRNSFRKSRSESLRGDGEWGGEVEEKKLSGKVSQEETGKKSNRIALNVQR